jgi:class 3 adenylate cyclase
MRLFRRRLPPAVRDLADQLQRARGTSEFVICVIIDIRDFTPFSKLVESPDVAVFIKRVLSKIIDEYFGGASFCKLMGDGIMLIIPYDETTLRALAPSVVENSFRLLQDFPGFCLDDPMVNYAVPHQLGIGIARGTACRLDSDGVALDYCGRVLNLSARLMDIARPSGIVLSADYAMSLLPRPMIDRFDRDHVYLRGVAEREPIEIYYTKDLTSISPPQRQPIDHGNGIRGSTQAQIR